MSKALVPEQREHFHLVSRATFSNPFSAERDALDRRIAEWEGDAPDLGLLDRLLARLTGRLGELEDRCGERFLDEYRGDDRAMLEHAVLFECFHRYADAMDALIADQGRVGSAPLDVPFADDLVRSLARRGIPDARAERALAIFYQLRRAFFFIGGLVGRGASMVRLRESLWNNVFTYDVARYEQLLWDRMEDFSTILLGETGTGKGAAAAAIGRSGFVPFDARRGRFVSSFTEAFLPLNLSEFPETLIESELFGHRRGAFTGAIDSHDGVLGRLDRHGAVFLDEIGEVSAPVQIKLLRVLQERLFTPVGSREPRRFEGRVLAATHRDVDALRADGRLREDFYYRLCSDVIRVPPLRQRLAEDPRELDDLLGAILPRLVGEPSPALAEEVGAAVRQGVGPAYGWPGNVRELEQCMRRVLLTRRCAPTRAAGAADPEAALLARIREGTLDARGLLDAYAALLHQRHGTYEQVARITGLDRRTVKKHVLSARGEA